VRHDERIREMIRLAHTLPWMDAARFEAYVRLRESHHGD
jgi:hypothetical protein